MNRRGDGTERRSPKKSKPHVALSYEPPYLRSFLPARISTPGHRLQRPKTKYYYDNTQKVEMHVARLARKLGVESTPEQHQQVSGDEL